MFTVLSSDGEIVSEFEHLEDAQKWVAALEVEPQAVAFVVEKDASEQIGPRHDDVEEAQQWIAGLVIESEPIGSAVE